MSSVLVASGGDRTKKKEKTALCYRINFAMQNVFTGTLLINMSSLYIFLV